MENENDTRKTNVVDDVPCSVRIDVAKLFARNSFRAECRRIIAFFIVSVKLMWLKFPTNEIFTVL